MGCQWEGKNSLHLYKPPLSLWYLLIKESRLWGNYYIDLSDVIWILLEILATCILHATFSRGGGWGVEMEKELIHMKVLLAVCQITCWISEYLQILQITWTYPSGSPREKACIAGKLRNMKTNEDEKGLRKEAPKQNTKPWSVKRIELELTALTEKELL